MFIVAENTRNVNYILEEMIMFDKAYQGLDFFFNLRERYKPYKVK